ncbi:MAG: rhodanese-like domain-containing protein [Nitrospirales bacterium]
MPHSSAFERLVQQAKKSIEEISVTEVKVWLERGEAFYFIDVREDHEWENRHAAGAIHIGRGILERDIERRIPDTAASIVLYCGGGYRSVLAAMSLGEMGYTEVRSMAGGLKAWENAGYSVVQDDV